MSLRYLQYQSLLAKSQVQQPILVAKSEPLWLFTSGGLLIILIALLIYSKWKINKTTKQLRYEEYKVESLQKRLNLALGTIRKWEENPDLIHSRDCNLDYIRMRMEESNFHTAIINQAKVKVKQFISTALRINLANSKPIGISTRSGYQIDETFDVTYQTNIEGESTRRVLFRIQIKLTKLPTQSSSSTITQIIDCIEKFLSPTGISENWQPTIQGYIVSMNWNQKAKPTPLLLLEQHSQGVNVSFRTKTNPKKKASTHRHK
jgi:hypothetical protein